MNYGFFTLALLGLGAHLGVALVQLGFALICLVYLLRKPFKDLDLRLGFAVAALAVLALFHSLVGSQGLPSADYLLRWRYLLLLLVVPAILDERAGRRLLDLLLLITGLSALYGLSQVAFESPGWLGFLHPEGSVRAFWRYVPDPETGALLRRGLRASGLIHNIAAFAHITALILLWPMARVLVERKSMGLWQLAAALLGLAGLMASGARAAWLGLAIGTLILLIMRFRPLWSRAAALLLAGALGLTGTALVLSPQFQNKAGSLTGREAIWAHCQETVRSTFPRGLGFGAHPQHAAETYPQQAKLKHKVQTWCHNLPLSLAVEAPLTLVPGAFLLILVILSLTRGPPGSLQAVALAGVLCFWTLAQVHDPHFQREFFPLAMMVVALGLIRRKPDDDSH